MLFESWSQLLRIPLVGIPAYIALLAMLRISGNRTLSKFNAFDFVITVSYGSVLATAFLQEDVTLAQVVAALAAIILLQMLITWTASRWSVADLIFKQEPRMVFHRGQFLDHAMRSARVSRSEILMGMRSQGIESSDDVYAVVLEPDGTLSVVRNTPTTASTLGEME